MNGRKGLFFFGAGLLASIGMMAASSTGCQSSDGTGGNASSNGGTNATSNNGGTNNVGGNNNGGSVSTSSNNGGGGASTTSSTGSGSHCTSDQDAKVTDVAKGEANGGLADGIKVQIKGAVVMSPKFLVSASSSGSCLWGVFLSEPGISTTAPYSGVLALSYGDDATTSDAGTFCPTIPVQPAGDAFPDDIKPGDVVDVIGKTSLYAPAQNAKFCPIVPVKQVQLANVCSVKKTGTANVPAPAKTGFDPADLAGQGTAAANGKWAGVKIEIDNVDSGAPNCTAASCTPPMNCESGVAGCFGDILLDGSGLDVADKIYYSGYLGKHFMKTCHNGPAFGSGPITFTSVAGFLSQDYCTWALFPNSKCTDLIPAAPASDVDCAASGGCTECTNASCN